MATDNKTLKKLIIKRKEFLKWKLNDYLDKADFYEEFIEPALEEQGHAYVSVDDLLSETQYIPKHLIANIEDLAELIKEDELTPSTYFFQEFNVEWV